MVNDKYSYNDFSDQSFLDVDPAEFSNTLIRNSNFYRQNTSELSQWFKIFPDGAENVTFEGCNLDNIELPMGTILDEWSTHKQFIMFDSGDVEV